MKPHRVAELLNISVSTLRLWAREFGTYLSANAQSDGRSYREFTDQDVRVLSQIAQLRRIGDPPEHIHNALKSLQAADWRELPPLPAPPPNIAPVPVVPEEAALADRRGLLREIAFRQERIEQLTTELEREREAANADRERLLREVSDLRQQLGVLQEQVKSVRDKTLLDLYEQGRIKPKDE